MYNNGLLTEREVCTRAAERLAGVRGKFFSVRVRCNCFPATLPQFFIQNFGALPKKTNILPFARKYLTQKNDWGPTKNFRGPPEPRGPGKSPPPAPPLGGPGLYCEISDRGFFSMDRATKERGPYKKQK